MFSSQQLITIQSDLPSNLQDQRGLFNEWSEEQRGIYRDNERRQRKEVDLLPYRVFTKREPHEV